MKSGSRREFTKRALVTGTVGALNPWRVIGANERINIALIGCGDRGTAIWKKFLLNQDVNPVAVCDVYENFLNRAAATAPGLKTYRDFREIIDRKDIDAVVIATPDHWHAIPTILACQAGKDVYVEKPLSLTVAEGRQMVRAARQHRRVVQTGSQQRSGPHYQKAIRLIQEGVIGPVHKISAGFTRNAMPGFRPVELGPEKPPGLDWEMWLGPAPYVPYDPFRCIYHFRWFWDYSGGQMTNWGAHNLDIARWLLKAKGPRAVTSFGGRYELKDGGQTPDVQEIIYQFDDCLVTWSGREVNRLRDEYLVFHGTKGSLSIMRDGYAIIPEIWRGLKNRNTVPEMDPQDEKGEARQMEDLHIRNFLDCVKSRQAPNADIEEGHLTATMCHLGNIATRLGRTLQWDATREQFIGDREANNLLTYRYRKPWDKYRAG
ncbi:MAG: Gfo/Idh/MocA family protein [Acidobacteriota bacterium]